MVVTAASREEATVFKEPLVNSMFLPHPCPRLPDQSQWEINTIMTNTGKSKTRGNTPQHIKTPHNRPTADAILNEKKPKEIP